jgi:hypothetical protein
MVAVKDSDVRHILVRALAGLKRNAYPLPVHMKGDKPFT